MNFNPTIIMSSTKPASKAKIIALGALQPFWSAFFYELLISPISIVNRTQSTFKSSAFCSFLSAHKARFSLRKAMDFFVSAASCYHQVFKAVIRFDAVNMVNYFRFQKRPSNFFLHHKAMLKNVIFISPNNCVALDAQHSATFPSGRIRWVVNQVFRPALSTSFSGSKRDTASAILAFSVAVFSFHCQITTLVNLNCKFHFTV